MPGKPVPSPCFLDTMEYLGHRHGQRRWRSPDKERLYTWDSLHGEIEVYNKRGKHVDAVSGELLGGAVRGRKIDV